MLNFFFAIWFTPKRWYKPVWFKLQFMHEIFLPIIEYLPCPSHSVALILLFQVYYSYINCLKPKLSFSTNDKPYTHIHVDHTIHSMLETHNKNEIKEIKTHQLFCLFPSLQPFNSCYNCIASCKIKSNPFIRHESLSMEYTSNSELPVLLVSWWLHNN